MWDSAYLGVSISEHRSGGTLKLLWGYLFFEVVVLPEETMFNHQAKDRF